MGKKGTLKSRADMVDQVEWLYCYAREARGHQNRGSDMKRMINITSIISFIVLLISGCAPVTEITSLGRPDYKPWQFSEDKLKYSKQRRCYTFDDRVLLRSNGVKIRKKQEAVEYLQILKELQKEKPSGKEKIYRGIAYAWAVPVGAVFKVIKFVASIPLYPFVYILSKTTEKTAFENYSQGKSLLKEGKYSEARLCFLKAVETDPGLFQYSDIYFMIAETYRKEEEGAQSAKAYYARFIDYSLNKYPVYFRKYDKNFEDDLNALENEFDEAEAQLGPQSRDGQ